jgi:hypothetical protein
MTRPDATLGGFMSGSPVQTGEHALEVGLPAPPSERGVWLLAVALALLGSLVLAAALTGVIATTGGGKAVSPPATPLGPAATPVAGAPPAPAAAAIVAPVRGARGAPGHGTGARVSRRWMEGFYPIYDAAQSTFAVNWLLLASIHRQESAFSTAPGIYRGLNFAHCCGGPMQFNVTNGPVSTWELVSDSYLYGPRPAAYNHMTATHPSPYDDFDSIMAAARLVSADGAGYALDGSAWMAAYGYYGHDATGVSYADEVLARAIGWSQQGFCINCGVRPELVRAVHAAYGAPVLALLVEAAHMHPRAGAR